MYDDEEHKREAIQYTGMQLIQLMQGVEMMWENYQFLFDAARDVDDAGLEEKLTNSLVEFEADLTDVLDQIRGHLYITTGIDEIEPNHRDFGDDFEMEVLTDIANLDTVDLEEFRLS